MATWATATGDTRMLYAAYVHHVLGRRLLEEAEAVWDVRVELVDGPWGLGVEPFWDEPLVLGVVLLDHPPRRPRQHGDVRLELEVATVRSLATRAVQYTMSGAQ